MKAPRLNLSNKTAPIVCFNIDNLLFKEEKVREGNFFTRLFSPQNKRTINDEFVHTINYIWRTHNVSIYMQTEQETEQMEDYINEHVDILYFSRMVKARGDEDLRLKLQLGEYFLYVDNDAERIARISHFGAIHMDDIHKHLIRK